MSEPQFETILTTPNKSKITKPKLRYTNFFFTINTNKRFDKYSKEYQHYEPLFIDIINKILNEKTLKHFVIFLKDGKWTSEYVNPGKIQIGVEIGDTSNCLHLHGLIKIGHRSNIRIDKDKLYTLFKQEINKLFNDTKDIYFDSKYFYSNSDNLEGYVAKQSY